MHRPTRAPGAALPLLACCLFAITAGPRTAAAEGRFGVAGLMGFHTYAQSDVNDNLVSPINALLSDTGLRMDDLSSGIGFGGGLRYRSTTSPVVLALDYERLTGSTTLDLFVGAFEVNAPANAFTATVYYYVPSSSRVRFGIGAGGGVYSSDGNVRVYETILGQELKADLNGTGAGFHGVGAADVTLSNAAHLEASVGYRYAKSGDLTVGGLDIPSLDGATAELDWSGLMTRVGVSYYFGAE